MRPSLVVFPLLLSLFAPVQIASAQSRPWSITVEVGLARFGGTSVDTTGFPGDPQLLPASPTSYGARVAREVGRVRLGLGYARLKSGLSIRSSDLIIVTREATLTLDEFTPEIGVRLVRLGTGVEVWLSAGPTLDLWSFTAESSRFLVGGQAGVTLEAPLGGAWVASLRAGGTISGSVIPVEDLPVEFLQRPTRRGAVGVGLTYRP